MASMQELLKYLEQFMHGQLNQHSTPTATPHPSGAPAPAMSHSPVGAMPSGIPAGMPPPGMPPPGAHPGMPPGMPPELAGAPPEQVQQAMQQFGQLHPELAPHLPSGGAAMDLQSLLGQLSNLPPAALAGFAPALDRIETELSDSSSGLGGPLDTNFGSASDLGDPFSDFGGLGDLNSSSVGDFGAIPAILNGGPDGDVATLQGFAGELEGDFPALASAASGDLGADVSGFVPTDGDVVDSTMAGFETDPFAESFDGFDPAATTFDDPTSAFGDGTELGHDVSAVNDDPYAQ